MYVVHLYLSKILINKLLISFLYINPIFRFCVFFYNIKHNIIRYAVNVYKSSFDLY